MNAPLLPAVELETHGLVAASVIWLHGLGADGNDFAGIIPELRLPAGLGLRFIFPHAPLRPVTINGGYVMRAWYDIASADFAEAPDAAGIRESEGMVRALIAREQDRGIATTRILLGGFSQGGAIALHTGLRCPEPLAGVVALSTYMPLADTLAAQAHIANAKLPVFVGHGRDDRLIPLVLAQRIRELLSARGHPVEWHEYPIAHSVCLPELHDLGNWLAGRLV